MRPFTCICCYFDMRGSGNKTSYFIVHKNSCLLNKKGKAAVLVTLKNVSCMHVLVCYTCVCVCAHARACAFVCALKVRAVLYSVLKKSEQNVIPRSFYYLGMTVVLNFECGWLYSRFRMAHRVLSKSDRQTSIIIYL
jgi:hypothetical protein